MLTHCFAAIRARPWYALGLLVLGGVFVVSAGSKLRGLEYFELQLIRQGVTNHRDVATTLSRLLCTGELLLGLLIWLPWWRRRLALPLTVAALVGFTLYLMPLWWRGDVENCGCFGKVFQMSPGWAMVKNLVLLPLAADLWHRTGPDRPRSWWWLLAGSAVAFTAVFVVLPPHRAPVAPAGQRPTPGQPAPPSRFAGFTAFQPQPADLTKGVCVVAFFSVDCEHCQAVAAKLTTLQAQLRGVPIYLILLGEAPDVPQFLAIAGGRYPYLLAEPRDFFPFVERKPPTLYLLGAGQVLARWDEPDPATLPDQLPARVAQALKGVAVTPLPTTPAVPASSAVPPTPEAPRL